MSKTVVGIFENESDAQNAQNYLLANGFGDGNVDIKTASYKTENTGTEDADEGLFDRIGHFFRDLFDGDEQETERYAEAGKRGTIVTVHATSAEEAEMAARVLDNYGAIDLDLPKSDDAPGSQYEDPIVNPPSVAEGQYFSPNEETRSVPLRSRIVDRQLQDSSRLRQQQFSADVTADDTPVTLNRTVEERDAMIEEIVENPDVKSGNSNLSGGSSFRE